MPEELDVFEREKAEDPFDLPRCLLVARNEHGKGFISQIRDLLRLALGPGRLQPSEYYAFKLYDDARFTPAEKREFIGRNAQDRIHLQCNAVDWLGVAHDKLTVYALLAGLGLSTPEVYGLYHRSRTFGAAAALRSRDHLAHFLRDGVRYPFFSKPVASMYSLGTASVEASDADALVFADGRRVAVERFIDEVSAFMVDGYLFQQRLIPHAMVRESCGEAISSVRVIVGLGDDRPEILGAVWKIVAGGNVADNFWRRGNMLAAIDVESGRVERVVRGTGPDQADVDVHPDTSQRLGGMRLPDWRRLTEECLRAATALPGLRLQAWDVAMCEAKPVFLEVNVGGDFNLPQIALGRGFLDARFRAFFDSCRRPR